MEGTSGIASFDWVNGFVLGTLLSGSPKPRATEQEIRDAAERRLQEDMRPKMPIPLRLRQSDRPLSSWVGALDPGTIYPDTVFSELAEWGIRYHADIGQLHVDWSGDLKSVRRYTPAELIKVGRQRGYDIHLTDESGYGSFSHEIAQDIWMLVIPISEVPDGVNASAIIRHISTRLARQYHL